MPIKFHAVIPCAGSGSRTGLNGPKQYAMLAGAPLVTHTYKAFEAISGLTHGVVVVAPDDSQIQQIFEAYPTNKFQISKTGGQTRAESVLAGLVSLRQAGAELDDWVLVHDAARCMITGELIEKLLNACAQDEIGGLLALPLPDTLKSDVNGRVANTLSRTEKWLAQTPQMFRWALLFDALTRAQGGATDESSAIEALGLSPLLVKGAAFNFKVTYAEDIAMAEALMRSRQLEKVMS
jgi:2-C-methyl-D-erythritol 4-phosphate cytidylyltransferase